MTDRVLLDGEGDRWFEVLPGKFSWGFSRWDAERRAKQTTDSGGVLYNAQTVARMHGGVKDVTPPATGLDRRATDELNRVPASQTLSLQDAWKLGYKAGLTDGRNGA
jgi:hypothetical protein